MTTPSLGYVILCVSDVAVSLAFANRLLDW
jgi:hypothetical protein